MRERKHEGRTIKKEIEIDAPADEVFEAWVDPEKIARWFVDKADKRAAAGEVVAWTFDEFFTMPIPFLHVEPDHIVIGGELPGRPPFLQEIFIETRGGRTVLRLLNSGFGDGDQWDQEYEGTDSGWTMALATLKVHLEHYAGRDRTHTLHKRPTERTPEELQPLYRTGEGLSRWLNGRVAVDGDIVQGEGFRWEVVARTPREVLHHWPDAQATVGLKCFPKDGAMQAAVDVSCWAAAAPKAVWDLTKL